jgi:hypothetical protein
VERADRPRTGRHLVQHPQIGQHRLTRRLEQESGPDGTPIGRPLVDRDVVAVAGECYGQRRAADAEPCDRDPHQAEPSSWKLFDTQR